MREKKKPRKNLFKKLIKFALLPSSKKITLQNGIKSLKWNKAWGKIEKTLVIFVKNENN